MVNHKGKSILRSGTPRWTQAKSPFSLILMLPLLLWPVQRVPYTCDTDLPADWGVTWTLLNSAFWTQFFSIFILFPHQLRQEKCKCMLFSLGRASENGSQQVERFPGSYHKTMMMIVNSSSYQFSPLFQAFFSFFSCWFFCNSTLPK